VACLTQQSHLRADHQPPLHALFGNSQNIPENALFRNGICANTIHVVLCQRTRDNSGFLYHLQITLSQRIQKFRASRSKNTEEYRDISKDFCEGAAKIFGLLWIGYLEMVLVPHKKGHLCKLIHQEQWTAGLTKTLVTTKGRQRNANYCE